MSGTTTSPPPTASPVGQGDYAVQPGDCMNSIALEHGFFWDSLWNLDANKDLREKRKNPNSLLPGDKVTIPPLRQRAEACKSGQRHRFKRKGEPTTLVFTMEYADGKPRANIKYRIVIDETIEQEGVTDAEGKVTIRIVGNAKQGVLTFDLDQEEPEEYELDLGLLAPVESVSGIQARLINLGYDCGDANGDWNDESKLALADFQEANKLDVSFPPSQTTLDKLTELHGS